MKPAGWGAALALAAALAGCGTGTGSAGGPLTVYLSVPLSGQRAAEGHQIGRGARQALAAAGGRAGKFEVGLQVLDDTAGGSKWSLVCATGADAREATENASTIAYLGELDQEATRTSAAITNLAEIPQVVVGVAPEGFGKSNLVLLKRGQLGKGAETGRIAIDLVLAAIRNAGSDGGDRGAVLNRLQKATGT